MVEAAREGEVLPANLEAEQMLLAELILFPGRLGDVVALGPQDFFWPEHGVALAALRVMAEAGEAVHPIGLGLRLRGEAAFGENDPVDYFKRIVSVSDALPPRWIGGLARTIIELSRHRALMRIGEAICNDALAPPAGESVSAMALRAITALQAVDPGEEGAEPPFAASVERTLRQAMKPEEAEARALPTGLSALDARLGGLRPGNFCVIAGRPGMGKSLLGNRLMATACAMGLGAICFSLEMGQDEVTARLMADLARESGDEIWYSTMRRGRVIPQHHESLVQAAADLARWPLVIDARPGLTMAEITIAAHRAAKRFRRDGVELALIVIDHIGLVQPDVDRRGNKVAEMTDISNGCKRLAKGLDCAVVGLSQLNRGVESRTDKRPILSDLRESGSIEQDADQVLLLYREAYYLKMRQATMAPSEFAIALDACRHTLEINSAKVRHGEQGVDLVDIDPATGSIRNRGTFS